MTNFGNLPFEKLLAAIREASISDRGLRDQALRAATAFVSTFQGWTGEPGGQGSRLRYCPR